MDNQNLACIFFLKKGMRKALKIKQFFKNFHSITAPLCSFLTTKMENLCIFSFIIFKYNTMRLWPMIRLTDHFCECQLGPNHLVPPLPSPCIVRQSLFCVKKDWLNSAECIVSNPLCKCPFRLQVAPRDTR